MPAASSSATFGSGHSLPMPLMPPPATPAMPALANMGIIVPPRVLSNSTSPRPPTLQLGNSSRPAGGHTTQLEIGLQFGYQMATLQHTCAQQAQRLEALEQQAQMVSEPTCDYDTDRRASLNRRPPCLQSICTYHMHVPPS